MSTWYRGGKDGRLRRLVLLLFALEAGRVFCIYHPELQSIQFDEVVNGEKHALVHWYAPFCGHCREFKPEFELLGKTFEDSSNVVIVRINGRKYRGLSKRYKVNGYPTVMWFEKGKRTTEFSDEIEDVSHLTTARALASFIKSRTGVNVALPKSQTNIISLNEKRFEEVVLNEAVDVLVCLFPREGGNHKKTRELLSKLADLYADEDYVTIASVQCTKNESVCETRGVRSSPVLLWFGRESKSKPEIYVGLLNIKFLTSYVNKKSGSDISEAGHIVEGGGLVEEYNDLVERFLDGTEASREEILNEMRELRGQFKSRKKLNSEYYVRIAENMLKTGEDFLSSEVARSGRELVFSELSSAEVKDLRRYSNVLNEFRRVAKEDKDDL
eukprot:CAMPEP_0113955238 /NCGR_PEP_ID=MMETSP0011_2-20120614/1168_1 /TAXON_ID=101924 /ORGANISM="Rhodosorus marinus" /LENGTH=384 /DNA_ID=CAMNT_0000964797 /DNA_START=117 /DNA_END=1271 /DNA_ORIENTATION=- /assembly_acc=CAM_ASM_000156